MVAPPLVPGLSTFPEMSQVCSLRRRAMRDCASPFEVDVDEFLYRRRHNTFAPRELARHRSAIGFTLESSDFIAFNC